MCLPSKYALVNNNFGSQGNFHINLADAKRKHHQIWLLLGWVIDC